MGDGASHYALHTTRGSSDTPGASRTCAVGFSMVSKELIMTREDHEYLVTVTEDAPEDTDENFNEWLERCLSSFDDTIEIEFE